jgi:hypothetical protein
MPLSCSAVVDGGQKSRVFSISSKLLKANQLFFFSKHEFFRFLTRVAPFPRAFNPNSILEYL